MVCGAISLSDQKIPAAETCRNCGHENVEVFCARCGQESSLHILPIGEAISDVVGEFISFDSRLYVTLKPLLTRPGFLTCEYLRGKRAAFIAPLRLYLMMSAVHFLLFSYYAQPQMQKMFAASASTNFSAGINVGARAPGASGSVTDADVQGSTAKAEKLARLNARVQTRTAEFGQWFSDHLSTLTLFFVPVYAGAMVLLFRRQKRLYMEHLIFMLHVHSFELLTGLPILLLPTQSVVWNTALSLTVVPLYTFFAMRRVYGQGPGKTIAKVLLLTLSYFFIAGFAGAVLSVFFIFR